MIQFKRLSVRRGSKLLFEQADVQIAPGERVGVVGANGAGKSSLFALLRDELLPDAGDATWPSSWRVAHVAQHAPHSSRNALDFVMDGDTQLRELELALARAEDNGDGQRVAELHAALSDHDAYTAKSRAEVLMLGLGFRVHELERPVDSFSGGWRMRLALAQTLMQPAELLLLDEPTNHLDLDAIVWLEQWLRERYRGTLLVISHDRDFLDAVIDVVLHIDRQRLVRYAGDYSSFERQRAERFALQQSASARQQATVERMRGFIERFKAKATKARQAQSRIKALERMELLAPIRTDAGTEFSFEPPLPSPDPMIAIEQAVCGYGADKVVLREVNFVLRRGERIGLLGANGQGKSTFIRSLVGELPWLGGHALIGKGVAVGYFAQYAIETMRADFTPIDYMNEIARDFAPATREQELRDFLGRFMFGGELATAPIGRMSGGEKARLALAGVVFRRPNLLLLDEPTNHLDLGMREAMAVALTKFDGSLIVVSHDRHLLRSSVDRFLLVADGRLREFNGDLDDYRDHLVEQARARQARSTNAEASSASTINKTQARRDEAARRQQRRAHRKPIEMEMRRLEESMTALQSKIDAIDGSLSSSNSVASTPTSYADLLKTRALHAAELEAAEQRWFECQEHLQALEE